MALSIQEVAALLKKYGKDEKDTGNTKVQIAIMTAEVKDLTDHLKANPHDFTAKRALNIDVAKRLALLTYLQRTDKEGYAALKKDLGLRK